MTPDNYLLKQGRCCNTSLIPIHNKVARKETRSVIYSTAPSNLLIDRSQHMGKRSPWKPITSRSRYYGTIPNPNLLQESKDGDWDSSHTSGRTLCEFPGGLCSPEITSSGGKPSWKKERSCFRRCNTESEAEYGLWEVPSGSVIRT